MKKVGYLTNASEMARLLLPAYRRTRWKWIVGHSRCRLRAVPTQKQIERFLLLLRSHLPTSQAGRVRSGGLQLEKVGSRVTVWIDDELARWILPRCRRNPSGAYWERLEEAQQEHEYVKSLMGGTEEE